jgi:hypothetical protein
MAYKDVYKAGAEQGVETCKQRLEKLSSKDNQTRE